MYATSSPFQAPTSDRVDVDGKYHPPPRADQPPRRADPIQPCSLLYTLTLQIENPPDENLQDRPLFFSSRELFGGHSLYTSSGRSGIRCWAVAGLIYRALYNTLLHVLPDARLRVPRSPGSNLATHSDSTTARQEGRKDAPATYTGVRRVWREGGGGRRIPYTLYVGKRALASPSCYVSGRAGRRLR